MIREKLWFILMITVPLVIGACGDDDDDDNNDDSSGSSINFDIEFPDDWSVRGSTSSETLIVGFAPDEGPTDTYAEFVEVTREFVPGIDLTAFVAETRSALNDFGGFVQLSQRQINIGGREGQEITYIAMVGESALRNIVHIYYVDDTGVILTASATSETFDDFRPIFDEILESFRIN